LRSNQKLTHNELSNSLKSVKIKKNDYIFLSGGEFSLHPECVEIASFLRRKGFVILTSNGMNIQKNEKLIKEVNCVQITLDSITSDYHDRYRGMQQQTIQGIRYLTSHGINTNVIVVLSKKNVGEFTDILSFCLKNKVRGLFVQLLWLPKEHELYKELILDEQDLESYFKVKLSLLEVEDKIHVPSKFYLDLLETSITSTLENYVMKNCFGMKSLFTIDPNGNINNCLPSDIIKDLTDSPSTLTAGYSFEDGVCKHFSNECLCFFGHLAMDYS